jgi:hypothetical protein
MSLNIYDSKQLPKGFRYPTGFDRAAANHEPAPEPWRYIDAKSEVGQLSWSLRQSDGRNLVPFATLETGDGDTACFDGNDCSGNPAVFMLVLDGSERRYQFEDFDDWLSQAIAKSSGWKTRSDRSSAGRWPCRVIASLDASSIQVTTSGQDSTRIPLRAVPPDLRAPNSAFWLDRNGDTFRVYRHEHDPEPAGTFSWHERRT